MSFLQKMKTMHTCVSGCLGNQDIHVSCSCGDVIDMLRDASGEMSLVLACYCHSSKKLLWYSLLTRAPSFYDTNVHERTTYPGI